MHILPPVLAHATLLKLVWLCKSDKVDTNSDSLERAALLWVMQFESGKHEWIINPSYSISYNIWSQAESDSCEIN